MKRYLYEKILSELEAVILAEKRPADTPFLSDQEICDQYQISRITARRIMAELVNKGYISRERGRGTFFRDISKPVRNQTIAFITSCDPGLIAMFGFPLLQSLENNARSASYKLTVCDSQHNIQNVSKIAAELLASEVQGVIFAPDIAYSKREENTLIKTVRMLERHNVPVVFADRILLNYIQESCFVISNNYAGEQMLVNHLVDLGYTRLAFITDTLANSAVIHRYEGFKSALFAHDLYYHEDFMAVLSQPGELEVVLDKWLEKPEPPQTICAVHDLMALEIIKALNRKGIRVPKDIAVVGFDNIAISSMIHPTLTTIQQDFMQMGKQIIEILTNRIENDFNALRKVKVDVSLVVRESCGSQLLLPQTS
jgi:DNA-binding LacI/PurR family transcriptional regulator